MSQESFITPFSSEWIYVTFRLQLILGSSQVQLTSLKKRVCSFPEAYQGYLKIQTAVDITDMDLPSMVSIKESLRKDLIMKAGRLNLNLQNAHQRKYKVLLMKTVFSQALPCVRETNLSVEDFLSQQPQFDAVYMSPRQQELSVFSHQYMVRDPKQYQWEYEVEFAFGESKQWKPQKIYCANCKITNAKYFCVQDQESYCEACFGDLHRSNRKSKHIKQAISPYNCPPGCQKGLHHNEPLTHYCFMCKQLKCTYCLADSEHKGNGQEVHQSMLSRQFAVLFNDTLRQKVNEIKSKIVGMIRQIQGKIQLISNHYEMRVKEFAKAFEERVSSVREWVAVQLNVAAGLHSELKRKFDQAIWLQTMSVQLQQGCDAEAGMQVKQGINAYINQCFSGDYFSRLQRKVQGVKLFS